MQRPGGGGRCLARVCAKRAIGCRDAWGLGGGDGARVDAAVCGGHQAALKTLCKFGALKTHSVWIKFGWFAGVTKQHSEPCTCMDWANIHCTLNLAHLWIGPTTFVEEKEADKVACMDPWNIYHTFHPCMESLNGSRATKNAIHKMPPLTSHPCIGVQMGRGQLTMPSTKCHP
eukprot:scaffold76852_cov17-Tisochrysis_lutea.AAC.1